MSGYATVDPTTNEVVARFPAASDQEALDALAASHRAFAPWAALTVGERALIIARAAELLRENGEQLARLTTQEMGKPITQARGEVALVASIFDYYASSGPGLIEDEELDIAGSGRAVVRTSPLGPLLGIMPWNFPYYQVGRFVAPNLLLGNTILVKHAESCPQQALRFAELLVDAGVPDGVYQNVFLTIDQVADMIGSPLLHGVSLTGSERAGRAVGELAGRHLKKCVLELGGSDPMIVLDGADVQSAVHAALLGRFGNAGQVCTSTKRLIIEDSLYDEFAELFVAGTADWSYGDPTVESTRMGPLSSTRARQDLASQVDDAVNKGATVLVGGAVPEGPGAYYPATVLTNVTSEMTAFHEELFGPVAVLYRVDSADDAISLANSSRFGLGAAVFAQDDDSAAAVADRLEVGMVGLNTTIKSAPDLPFGGVKASGLGRELGRFGLDEFCNKKLVRQLITTPDSAST
jgi:acyl-CoA reductase-like NAD-dependent aldehyde dehydrogenase